MRAVRQYETGPERVLHHALRTAGLRFSKNYRNLPGSPDIVFRRDKLAFFVHGCFWHRHEGCPRSTTPRSNRQYWLAKFAANVERDKRKIAELRKLGWKVIVLWQCEIESDAAAAARRVIRTLARIRKKNAPLAQ
jgi:DNA mismatch endonuclease (patch repair protein)